MGSMRICSLLPSATEIIFTLGLEENLQAVTHECDYPPEAQNWRVVVNSILPDKNSLSSAQIDEFVRSKRAEGKSVYIIDSEQLGKIKPDIIITQGLCDVCAVSGGHLEEIRDVLDNDPEIVSLSPSTIEEIMDSILLVGKATGRDEKAKETVSALRKRIDAVRQKLKKERYHPGVFCLEWLDPPYAAGHWVPEMVEIAGGKPIVSLSGKPSFPTDWDAILESRPDYMILMPCGFDIEQTLERLGEVTDGRPQQWHKLPAVKKGHCYVVDANSHFSSPSPRIVDGIELLARILHPEIFTRHSLQNSFVNLKNYFYLQTFLG